MLIVHIPSWYPNDSRPINGIFIKKQIEAISEFDNNQHVVLNWHNTISYSLKNPIRFFRELISSCLQFKVIKENKIEIIQFSYFHTYYPLFGDNDKRLQKKIIKIIDDLNSKTPIGLIHTHVTFPAGFIGKILKTKLKIPYIISEHMGPFPFDGYKADLKNNIVDPIQNANKVVAVSTFLANEINFHTKAQSIVVPNVIDEREFILSKKINHEYFTFLFLGALSHVKGVDILIRAIAELKKYTDRKFIVKIVGNGDMKFDLQLLASNLNVDDYLDWQSGLDRKHVVKSISETDCLVSASRHESFGVAIVEALACGKPVITTRSGGPSDTINELNGIFVEKENPEELSKGMLWMMKNIASFDPVLIRKNFEEKFSRKVIAEKYIEIYNEIIKD